MLQSLYNRIRGRGIRAAEVTDVVQTSQEVAPTGKPDATSQIRAVPIPYAYVGIKEQNLLNDDSLYAVYNVFSDILLSSGWTFEGNDAQKVEKFTDKMTSAPGWTMLLNSMAACSFKRFSAVEIIWDTVGGWTPHKYRDLPLKYTSLNLDEWQDVVCANISTTDGLQTLWPQNMICHRNEPTFEHPLGQSVYDRLAEVIGYKRKADALLIRILERLAGATLVGWYAPGTPDAEQQALFNALKQMQSASVAIFPGPKGEKGNDIDLLELSSSAGLDFAINLLQMYERRIARAILGSVLSMYEAEHGSRAQAQEHTKILTSVIESQQDGIEEPINRQLLQPMLAYNLPNGADLDVKFKLNTPDFSDLSKTGAWIDGLIAAGAIDVENQEDNDMVRALFGLKLRDWKKYPEVPIDERREQEVAANMPPGAAGAGSPPKLPKIKAQNADAPKVA